MWKTQMQQRCVEEPEPWMLWFMLTLSTPKLPGAQINVCVSSDFAILFSFKAHLAEHALVSF